MPSIAPHPLPNNALLARYRQPGYYTDCYATAVTASVSHAQFVEMFYTSWLFKLERLILKVLASKPSTDAQARELASAQTDRFAAWVVEDRASDQLLLSDFRGRTRSWLMTEPLAGGATQLLFGSAVTPVEHPRGGQPTLGFAFRALLGFHKLYSRALLACARRRLMARL